MDYGKKNIQKRNASLSRKKAHGKKKFWLNFFRSLFIFLLVLVAGAAVCGVLYVRNLVADLPDASTIDISPTGFSTTVYDAEGNEIETLASSGANREYVTLDEIPDDLINAFIAIEDSRFYSHNGVDPKGILRAGFSALTTGDLSQGASTITQQLLKNNYFTGWTSEDNNSDRIKRKLQEQYLAIELEKYVDKNTILENYLNTINLGQNTLGVESASERYFNKSVSDLSLSESAVIAGITQNPARYNPITNPEENAKRREKVLRDMKSQGMISETEYNEALSDDVYERISIVNAISTAVGGTTSYFVDALTEQVIDDLIEQKGYSETEAYTALYSGGLEIYSTQEPRIQTIVDEEVNNQNNYPSAPKVSFSYRLTIEKPDGTFENYSEQTMLSYYQAQNPNYDIIFNSEEEAFLAIAGYKAEIMGEGDTIPENGETLAFTLQPQIAVTIMDQTSGKVLALCGGRGDKIASRTLNRATDITRQPGSTFKVLAAYAPALDAAGLTLASVQDDAPTTYANGTPLHNWDNKYLGFTTFRQAITTSINVVTVKTLTQISTGLGYEYVQDFGITTLESGDNNQALALGGITNGVKNLELCGAYATIANHGEYNKPIFYTEIRNHRGDIILDNTENQPKEVLKETTAWLLTSAMKDVMTIGNGASANPGNAIIAGKSGTTTSDRDTIFAGYSTYYTCALWGGYDDNSPIENISFSKEIFKQIMFRLHDGLEMQDFEQPPGIKTAFVCKKSGKLAIDGVCNNDPRGNMAYIEYFADGTVPTENCDHHVRLTICNESRLTATEYCPSVSSGVYIVGGSQGTADSPYLVNAEAMFNVCNIHTSETAASAEKEDTDEKKDNRKKTDENSGRKRNANSNQSDDEDEDEDVTDDEPIDDEDE